MLLVKAWKSLTPWLSSLRLFFFTSLAAGDLRAPRAGGKGGALMASAQRTSSEISVFGGVVV